MNSLNSLIFPDRTSVFRHVEWRIGDILVGCGVIGIMIALPFLAKDWLSSFPFWIYWSFYLLPSLMWLTFFPVGICVSRSPGALTANKSRRSVPAEFGIAVLVYLGILMAMCGILMAGYGIIGEEAFPKQRFAESPGSGGLVAWFVYAAAGVTLGPISEEIFFRGFLYNAFVRWMPRPAAILLQGAIFAVIHPFGISYMVLVFFLGIVLALIYEWRQTLLAPIFVHIFQNLLAFTLLSITIVSNANAPYLGIQGKPEEAGLRITTVHPGSPADECGLRAGDLLTRFDGSPIHSIEDLRSIILEKQSGDGVPLVISRDEKELELTAVLRPPD